MPTCVKAAAAPQARVTVAGSTITACKPDGADCRSIPFSPALRGDETGEAWVSPDGALVALLVPGRPIQVLDASGKRRSVIPGWPTAMSADERSPAVFRQARFVGPALALFIADTPVTSAIRLVDPRTGNKLGDVAEGRPMSDGVEPVDLGANRFAFVEFDTSAIVVHDVATGRLVRRYPIEGVEPAGYAQLVLAPDRTSLLAVQGERVLRLDLATGQVGPSSTPRCPE